MNASEGKGGREAERPERGPGHKRLPRLWVVCVVSGIAGLGLGAYGVWLARMAGRLPAAVLVWVVLAVPWLVGTVGLWMRSDAARVVMMLYFYFATMAMMGGCAATFVHPGIILLYLPLVAVCVACLKHLWNAREYFIVPPDQKPPIWSLPALAALLVVLAVGLPLLLLVATAAAP